MSSDTWVWVGITADDWASLRDVWADMVASWPGAFVETTADIEAMSERQWRERAASLSGEGRFAQAVLGSDGTWWGFASAYLDELSRERNAFVTHVHARRGHDVAGDLIERVLDWASAEFVEAVVLEVRDDHEAVVDRYRRHGFGPTGAARRRDDHHLELELACLLPGGGVDDIRWRTTAHHPMSA